MIVKGKGNVIVHSWKWKCPVCGKEGYKYISKWKSIRGFNRHLKCCHDKVIDLVGERFDITKVEPRLKHNQVRGYVKSCRYYNSVPMDYNVRKNKFEQSYGIKEDIESEDKELIL